MAIPRLRLLAAMLAFGLALPLGAAAAAPRRLTIGPVSGDRRAAISTQLAETLCGVFECVLWPTISTAGRADPAKMRRAGVEAVLTGAVRETRVTVLLSWPAGVLDRWTFDLGPGRRLRGEALDRIAADVGRRFAPPAARGPAARPAPPPPPPPAAPPPEPPAASRPQPPATVARPPAPAPKAAAPAPPRAAPAPAPARPGAAPAAPAPRATPPRAHPRLAAELGGFWSSRALSFGGVGAGSGTLYEYDASAILGPRARLEVYPAAGHTAGLAGGLGLFAEGALSVGLTTEAPDGGERDSDFRRVSAGVLWRLPAGARVTLVPSVAYDSLKLGVDPPIAGLPDADLAGLAVKLGVELRVAERVKLLLAGGYVAWLTARELVDGDVPYFPGDGAAALEGQAGIDVALGGPFSLRVLSRLSNTSYALDPDPTGTYAAEDATDRFVSAYASVRAEL